MGKKMGKNYTHPCPRNRFALLLEQKMSKNGRRRDEMAGRQNKTGKWVEKNGLQPIFKSGLASSFFKIVALYLDAQERRDFLLTSILRDNVETGTRLLKHYNGDKTGFQLIINGIENMSALNLNTIKRQGKT